MAKLTKAQRTALDGATQLTIELDRRRSITVERITCAPRTARALFDLGIAGPVVRRFAVKAQAPHGRWYNEQVVECDLLHSHPQPLTR